MIPDVVVGEDRSILAPLLRFVRLLDHLIRSRQHIRRNRQAERLGGFKVDHEVELRWLLNWRASNSFSNDRGTA